MRFDWKSIGIYAGIGAVLSAIVFDGCVDRYIKKIKEMDKILLERSVNGRQRYISTVWKSNGREPTPDELGFRSNIDLGSIAYTNGLYADIKDGVYHSKIGSFKDYKDYLKASEQYKADFDSEL